MVRVVNVRGMRTPEERANIVYVGRAWAGWPQHEFHNPFPVRTPTPAQIRSALERYRARLAGWSRDDLDLALMRLWGETDYGAKPLGCWCIDATHGDGQPVVCHAQILAAMLAERFTG